jgi:hypothetical protein
MRRVTAVLIASTRYQKETDTDQKASKHADLQLAQSTKLIGKGTTLATAVARVVGSFC